MLTLLGFKTLERVGRTVVILRRYFICIEKVLYKQDACTTFFFSFLLQKVLRCIFRRGQREIPCVWYLW